jgi:hypothetical protein
MSFETVFPKREIIAGVQNIKFKISEFCTPNFERRRARVAPALECCRPPPQRASKIPGVGAGASSGRSHDAQLVAPSAEVSLTNGILHSQRKRLGN